MMECHFHQSHSRQGTKKKNFSVEVLESLYSNKHSTHLDTSHENIKATHRICKKENLIFPVY